jgi:hypothetical protein
LIRRGWSINRSRKTVLFAAASLGLLGAFTPLTATAGAAIAIVGAVLFGQLAWTSTSYDHHRDRPKEHVAILGSPARRATAWALVQR